MSSGEQPKLMDILKMAIVIAVPLFALLSFAAVVDITAIHEANVETEGAIENVTVDDEDSEFITEGDYTYANFMVTVSQGDVDQVEIYRLTNDGEIFVDKNTKTMDEGVFKLRDSPPKTGDYKAIATKNGTVVGTAYFEVRDGQAPSETIW